MWWFPAMFWHAGPTTSNVKWTWWVLFVSSATEETSSRYNVLSVEYFFDWTLAFDWFPNFSWLIVRAVLIRSSNTGTKLLSSPFNSTSAAFLFWFLVWFACILAFLFVLRVDVPSLELMFGCFDCFVRRLFPLLCLPLAVVCFFLLRFQYWN